jgi:hypothetical protein
MNLTNAFGRRRCSEVSLISTGQLRLILNGGGIEAASATVRRGDSARLFNSTRWSKRSDYRTASRALKRLCVPYEPSPLAPKRSCGS